VLETSPSPTHASIARALRRMLAKLYRPDLQPLLDHRPVGGRHGDHPTACPSSSAELATHRFAEVDTTGRVVFEAIPVRIGTPGTPNHQPRLTGPCKQHRCAQWDGFCRLGAAAARAAFELGGNSPESGCPITNTCRWRMENGDAACVVCPWLHRVAPEELILMHEGVSK